MSVSLAVLSAAVVLRLLGVDRPWPWRVADLTPGTGQPDPAPPEPAPPDRAPSGAAPNRSGGRRGHASRARRALDRAVEQDLPVAADLLRLAVDAGHSPHTAVGAVGRVGVGPVCRALGRCAAAFDSGARLVDELTELPRRLGPALGPLSATLVVALESGSPVGPALQRLADSERRRRRRRVEARVRRLPVLLLGPLVGLILPAFVLLTIVPVGITTARTATGLVPS